MESFTAKTEDWELYLSIDEPCTIADKKKDTLWLKVNFSLY